MVGVDVEVVEATVVAAAGSEVGTVVLDDRVAAQPLVVVPEGDPARVFEESGVQRAGLLLGPVGSEAVDQGPDGGPVVKGQRSYGHAASVPVRSIECSCFWAIDNMLS
jgi:hypothetical protein